MMALQDFFDNCEDACYPKQPVYVGWEAKGRGFGEFYFYTKEDEEGNLKIYCDNELCNKEFIKKMLCKMVDDAELTEPR